jgi:hypothetical protein
MLISNFFIPTITKRRGRFGQPVCARAVQARWVFAFVTPKESIAGFSVAPNPSEPAMELSSIGSGVNLDIEERNDGYHGT